MIPKRQVFRFLTVAGIVLLGLGAAEVALRYREGRIARSDQLDPGLIIHDEQLGWKLNPGWRGAHRHHDFSTAYAIASGGFREPDLSKVPSPRRWLVVGDSFTFGFGVDDGETFVDRLNELSQGKTAKERAESAKSQARGAGADRQEAEVGVDATAEAFLNLAVPGYSTDQEMLLIESQLPRLRPAGVILVVYLGNDLLDNLRSVPLQVPLPKPFFELADDGLVPRNTPVPRTAPHSRNPQLELRRAVLGEQPLRSPLPARWIGQSALLRTLGAADEVLPADDPGFEERFDPALELFVRLMERLRAGCVKDEVELVVVLMPGRSYVERPESLSAAYQEHFRSRIVALKPRLQVEIIDLASELRRLYQADPAHWFFPNDGHLTAAGHREVARLLNDALAR